jgi:predicted anti-sigma-YlaC factor YlaD
MTSRELPDNPKANGVSSSQKLFPITKPLACIDVQEQLSVHLDLAKNADEINDSEHVLVDRTSDHLRSCKDCARYAQGLAALQRATLRMPTGQAANLVPAVMARIRPTRSAQRPPLGPAVALGLMVTAFAQLVGAVPHLFGSVSKLSHLSREAAAFEIALGAGFLYAAVQPRVANGIRMMATVLTAMLFFTTTIDLAQSALSLPLESHHLVALLGTALLWCVPKHEHRHSLRSLLAASPIS